jgi:hypothetical protein
MGSAMSLCVGAQGFVAFGNVQRWGGGFSPRGSSRGTPGVRPEVSSQVPPEVSSKRSRGSPQGPRGVPQGCPQGFLHGFPRILNLRWGLLAETSVLYLLLRCMLLSRARMWIQMLKWKVCIAVAGRSLQSGRSLTIPWETPKADARASPPRRPRGGRPRLPP